MSFPIPSMIYCFLFGYRQCQPHAFYKLLLQLPILPTECCTTVMTDMPS